MKLKKGVALNKLNSRSNTPQKKKLSYPNPKRILKQPKKVPENEDVRTRLNEFSRQKSLPVHSKLFFSMYQGALFIWGDKAEDELAMIIGYVNVEKSVQNPLGFIKSQIQLAWEAYERGEKPTFADLQPTKERTTGREEIIPDWFKKSSEGNEPKGEKDNANIAEEREALLRELAEMKNKVHK